MKKLILLTAAIVFALAAGAGAAEPAKPTPAAVAPAPGATGDTPLAPDAVFRALDKDGDASLLQSDFPTAHDLSTDLFAAFDTNKDQRLSTAEYSVYAGGRADDDAGEEEEEEAE